MTRNVPLLLALGSALALVQCSGTPERSVQEAEARPVSVKVGQVETTSRSGGFAATGTVQSKTITPIASKVMGYVTAAMVREGERVSKGQLLVEIDPRDSRTQLAQAKAGVEEARQALEEVEQMILAADSASEAAQANATLAETTLERFRTLLERKSVSEQEFDEALARNDSAQAQLRQSQEMLASARAKKGQVESRIRQAQAHLEQAELYVSYTRVTAPFSGVVSDRQVEVGQLASPGLPLMTIEDAREFEVEAMVAESRIQNVRVGSDVTVDVSALNQQLQGTVREIVPRADAASRSFIVKVRVEPVEGLRSGMYATTYFGGPGAAALTIPESAVVRRGQLVGVYLVGTENHARFRLIETGRSLDGRIEVLAGLSEGDRVVVDPSFDLRDGSPVTISSHPIRPPSETAPAFESAVYSRDVVVVEC